MKSERFFILAIGLIPGVWVMWQLVLSERSSDHRSAQSWVFIAWLWLPAIVAGVVSVSPRRIVGWVWKRLPGIVLMFLGGTLLLLGGMGFRELAGSAWYIWMIDGAFLLVGAVFILLSLIGRDRVVEKTLESIDF